MFRNWFRPAKTDPVERPESTKTGRPTLTFTRLCGAWYEAIDRFNNRYWVFGDTPPAVYDSKSWSWALAADVRLDHDNLSWPLAPPGSRRFETLREAKEDLALQSLDGFRSETAFDREESEVAPVQRILSTIRDSVGSCTSPESAWDLLDTLDESMDSVIPGAPPEQRERMHIWRMHIRGLKRGLRSFADRNLGDYGHLTEIDIKRICQLDVLTAWTYWTDRGELPITAEVRRGIGLWSESKTDTEMRAIIARNWSKFYDIGGET